jgi:hypothetical protein
MSPETPALELLTTNRKALVINLDGSRYGTFAEIGAGQEIARHFFQAGGASGTVAKTMSAYDMAFSDAIYGKNKRYVSRQRLETMLDHEYALLIERLATIRGEKTRFYVCANTVAARNFKGDNACHGWVGVRFQAEPQGPPNDILVHVRMWDRENVQQQHAVGILGVNLLYGACYLRDDPRALIRSLIDNLGSERIEVDFIEFGGPALAHFENHRIALQLVEEGLTNAVIFSPEGNALVPAEAFYKRAVLVQRGSFRPVTHVNVDIMRAAAERFAREPAVHGKSVLPLFELSTPKLQGAGPMDHDDVLARVATLNALGGAVLISNFRQYFRLTAYFRRYTPEMIGAVMGVRAFGKFLDESAYAELDGGLLEALGRLFKNDVRLYVYPRQEGATLWDATSLPVPENIRHLRAHLVDNGLVESLTNFDPAMHGLSAREALRALRAGEPAWEHSVPDAAARVIKERRLFGLARRTGE